MPEQLPALRGNHRLYASVTPEFRDLVVAAAREQNLPTQDYVLLAIRDRLVAEHHPVVHTIQRALESRKTPHHLKEAIHSFEQWLKACLGARPPEM